jgi:uroporphyrinogen-III decarboxylase
MTEQQWQTLLAVTAGKPVEKLPLGFIIDCPWLPGWGGITAIDYFASEQKWFELNLKAIQTFPEVMFLPGFWAEYGMCTEPSAFGAKCIWHTHDMPFAEKTIHTLSDIDGLTVPNPKTDGLCPFVLQRLKACRSQIEAAGHAIRFAVARGPLNVASFLMGTTEFMMGIYDDPKRIHQLLDRITQFLCDWLTLQKETFDTIDGILILDDIVGFLGQQDVETFVLPYMKRIFNCLDVSVIMFHNDANGRVCAPYLADLGVNLFNFGFEHSITEMREWTGGRVPLLGNVPPRDILALGTPDQIKTCVQETLSGLDSTQGLIFSCGGGMPDAVSSDNIRAFIETAQNVSLS